MQNPRQPSEYGQIPLSSPVIALHEDYLHGGILAGTYSQFLHLDPVTNLCKSLLEAGDTGPVPVRAITSVEGTQYWIGLSAETTANQALYFMDETGIYPVSLDRSADCSLPPVFVFSVCSDIWPILWIGTLYNGLLMYSPGNNAEGLPVGRISVIADREGIGDGLIHNIVKAGPDAGSLWLATECGLVRADIHLDPTDFSITSIRSRIWNESNGFPASRMKCLVIDHGGVLWIGTTGSGLIRMAQHGEDYEVGVFDLSSSGLPDNFVFAVACDKYNNIWCATDAGLARVSDGANITTYSAESSFLKTNQLRSLFATDQMLYVGHHATATDTLAKMRGEFDEGSGGVSWGSLAALLGESN